MTDENKEKPNLFGLLINTIGAFAEENKKEIKLTLPEVLGNLDMVKSHYLPLFTTVRSDQQEPAQDEQEPESESGEPSEDADSEEPVAFSPDAGEDKDEK